jgi:hypothetical protein
MLRDRAAGILEELFSSANSTEELINELRYDRGYPEQVAENIAYGELDMRPEAIAERRLDFTSGNDTPYFHGGYLAEPGFRGDGDLTFVTPNAFLANTYIPQGSANGRFAGMTGQIYPLAIDTTDFLRTDARGDNWGNIELNNIYNDAGGLVQRGERGRYYETDRLGQMARRNNYPGIFIDNVVDIGQNVRQAYNHLEGVNHPYVSRFPSIEDSADVVAINDPTRIRSRYAAFDPEYKGSNILGATAAAGVGLGALAAPGEAEAKSDEFIEGLPQLQPYEPGMVEGAVQSVAQFFKDIGLTDSDYTANQMANSLSGVADFAPVLGDVKGFAEARDAFDEGNYGEAALLGGLGLLGAVPMLGDVAAGAIKGAMSTAAAPMLNMTPNIEKALDKTPELENVLPYVTEAEAARISPRTSEKTVAAFNAINPTELRGAAVEGAPKLGWYQASSEAINSIFEGDAQRFSALLAALSPQTSVESNLINTVNTFANWEKAGRPQDPNVILEIMGQSVQGNKGIDSVLGAWRNNAIRALTAAPNPETGLIELSGPKVYEFSQAIQGDLNRFTNDAWQANITGVPQSEFGSSGGNILPGYSPGYIGASARGRQVAEDMSLRLGVDIMPSEVQETGWSFGKALFEQATEMQKTDPTMTAERILQEGLLDPQRIADVPDFASLFTMPEYGQPLREIGYGSLIDEAARASTGFGNRDLSAAASPEGALNVARRLDQLRDYRNFVSDSKPFRPRFRVAEKADGGWQGLQQPYREPSGRSVSLDFGAKGREVAPNPEYARKTGVNTTVYQLNKSSSDRKAFVETMRQAQESRGAIGRSVDVYDPNDYQGYKLFSTQDGAGGFAISPTGELSSVVSRKGAGLKSFSDAAISAGVANGARWLNAFDTVLPNKYGRFGFKPIARLKFDEGFARSDWGDEAVDKFMENTSAFNGGKPDLVFMVYDPTFEGVVGNSVGGQLVDDYDKAVSLVEREIEKLSKKDR